jgi:plasmid stabilization system protein ParE
VSRLKFANRARKDLQEIHDFIAEDNVVAAERVIKLLETRCRDLVDMPNIGRKRENWPPASEVLRKAIMSFCIVVPPAVSL